MPKRPEVLEGDTIEVKTKCGKIYVTVNHNESGALDEVLIRTGIIGDSDKKINMNPCCKYFTELLGKLATHHIRNKLETNRIVKQCESTTDCIVGICKYPDAMNCGDAIAYALRKYISEGKDLTKSDNIVENK